MIIDRKLSAILKKTKKSFLLLGPRQTGKSTLIRSLNPEVEINLADEETFVEFLADPGLLKQRTTKVKKVFVDEIQRIPSLLNSIQALIDSEPSRQFMLTGSSARKLKRGKVNLLPGRIHSYELGPLSPLEIPHSFDIQIALKKGLLPGIYLEKEEVDWKRTLQTYSRTYLKEEIQAEALTRNLEGFSRFFEAAVSRTGDFIDFSKMASLAQIERMSARRYFDILVDTLIVTPVDAFTKSSRRQLVQHPRYYLFDVGVLNAALRNFEVSVDRIGLLFETLFLQSFLSTIKSTANEVRVSVYRTANGAEVDFIIEKDRELFAVEVKATKRINKHDLNGLKSFKNFVGKKKCQSMVVYLGSHAQVMGDTEVLPFVEAITRLSGDL